jgi:hypothetical protein
MTFINLLSLIVTPTYSHVYLASSRILEEAKRREHAQFRGDIGSLREERLTDADRIKEKIADVQFVEVDAQWYFCPLGDADPEYELNCAMLQQSLGKPIEHGYKVKWAVSKSPDPLRFKSSAAENRILVTLFSCGHDMLLHPRTVGLQPLQEIWGDMKIILSEYLELPFVIRTLLWLTELTLDAVISLDVRGARERKGGWRSLAILFGSIFIGLASIAFVGEFSLFQAGQSTLAQRVWTMSWLVFGITLGPASFFRASPDPSATLLPKTALLE